MTQGGASSGSGRHPAELLDRSAPSSRFSLPPPLFRRCYAPKLITTPSLMKANPMSQTPLWRGGVGGWGGCVWCKCMCEGTAEWRGDPQCSTHTTLAGDVFFSVWKRALASSLMSGTNLKSDSQAELSRLHEMKQAWTQRAYQSSIQSFRLVGVQCPNNASTAAYCL